MNSTKMITLTLFSLVGLTLTPAVGTSTAYAQEVTLADLPGDSEAVHFARRALEVESKLEDFCTYDQKGLLLPIRKAAMHLWIEAHSASDLSREVREAAVALERAMSDAEGFIDEMLEVRRAWTVAVEVEEIRKQLQHILR